MYDLFYLSAVILCFLIYAVIKIYLVTKKYRLKKERNEKYRNEVPGRLYETTILLLIKNFFQKNSIFKNVFLKNNNGNVTEIDILAVHNTGIYVLECKNYFGSLEGSINDKLWYHTNKKGIKYEFLNPVKQNEIHLAAVKRLLQKFDLPYYSIIIFSNKCKIPNITYKADNAYIIYQKELVSLIKYLTSQKHIYSNKVINKISDIIKQENIINTPK